MRKGKNMQVVRNALTKVPEVTVFFWIIKVLTTGMGETTSDYLAHTYDPVVAVGAAGLVLGVVLAIQFWSKRYVAWIYWLAVVMVSVFGTMAADVLHAGLGVPYMISAIFFSAVLALIFTVWYKTEKTLSIHSIYTKRREFFYWATVLTTFALGTAVGDLTAMTWNMGFLESGIMFAILIAIPTIAYWKFGWNDIFAFWFAYVLTRPLGACFADWMAVPVSSRGLGLEYGPVSLGLTAIILGLVAYMAITKKDEMVMVEV